MNYKKDANVLNSLQIQDIKSRATLPQTENPLISEDLQQIINEQLDYAQKPPATAPTRKAWHQKKLEDTTNSNLEKETNAENANISKLHKVQFPSSK
jgi:hypothetical protein